MKPELRRLVLAMSCLPLTLAVTNCGGSDDPAAAPAAASTTVSGSVVKGPCNSATVRVLNAATGAQLGTATTNATGAYTLDVPFTGDVIIEASGGTCADEATGGNVPLSAPMRSVLTLSGGNVTGVVTPLTTLAYSFAFGTATTGVTASAFNTKATLVATQFQLGTSNIATTVPVVTGSTNAYGRVLRGISYYLQAQGVTLPTLTNSYFTGTAQWAAFTGAFNSAYLAGNPGQGVTFSFDGTGLAIAGTGIGGGSGSCGINVQGTVTANGFTVPVNLNYCVAGIAAGSCGSGNATLSQALAGQAGLAGGANLNYSFAPTCAAGAITITLQ